MYTDALPEVGTIIELEAGDGWDIIALNIPDIIAISWIYEAYPELRLGLKGGFQWPEKGRTAIVVNTNVRMALALCPALPTEGGDFLLLQKIRNIPGLAD